MIPAMLRRHVLPGALLACLVALPARAQETQDANRSPDRTSSVARSGAGIAATPLAPGAAPVSAEILEIGRGHARVVPHPVPLDRVLLSDPEVADALPVSPREVVVNGTRTGSTTLLLWGVDGSRAQYRIRVTPDVEALAEEIRRRIPGEAIEVSAIGESIVLSGRASDPALAERAELLARSVADGDSVLNRIAVPDRPQVLLQVRFAEVGRSALRELGSTLLRVDPANPRGDDEGLASTGATGALTGGFLDGEGPDPTFSDQINFFLFQRSSNVALLIRALRDQGLFRSLAEPNLLAIPGEEASFLAGGEFPFPVLQGTSQAVTIQFREFGIRLSFTPRITPSGAIRLEVAPEVSSLDFAGGLRLSGFDVPALLSRKARTVVQLRDGETFAIAGLLDQSMTTNSIRIPFLGDIPILGSLFRSDAVRQNRSELLVLVTPRLVLPDREPPPVPSGEADTWEWMRGMEPEPAPSGADPADPADPAAPAPADAAPRRRLRRGGGT